MQAVSLLHLMCVFLIIRTGQGSNPLASQEVCTYLAIPLLTLPHTLKMNGKLPKIATAQVYWCHEGLLTTIVNFL